MKKFLAFSLLFALLTSAAYAESHPAVDVAPSAAKVPQWVVDDLLSAYPDAAAIHIYDWHADDARGRKQTINPLAYGWDYEDISVKTTATGVTLHDVFLHSVAKGEESKLSATWSKTFSASLAITATEDSSVSSPSSGTLGVSGSVTATYSTSVTFFGPPESSPYNSREYRVRFYGNRGTWSATAVRTVNPARRPRISGTWEKPLSYARYSIDKKIE